MTLYMPPLSTKKKGGEQKRDPDSKRVFGNYEEDLPAAQSHYSNTHNNVLRNRKFSPAKSRILSPARQHNPHPSQVGFLLQDCRLINEPICDVKPQVKEGLMDPESNMWWKWQSTNGETTAPARKTLPKYSYNSSNRDEYRKPVDPKQGQTRHGNNPNSHPSSGIVPITGLPSERGPRLLLEHISYDHQYNSRTNPSQPIRGKKHGSFVWDCFHPVSPPKLTTGMNRTTVLSAPWASSSAQDEAGSTGVPPLSKLSPVTTANITRQEEVGLGTLGSTLPPSLPAVAS